MEWAIIGRRAEREAVAAFLDDLGSGSGALVLEGDAGIGKTAVWLEAVAAAKSRGYTVLTCRPVEAEATLSFVSLGDLLEPILDGLLPALLPLQRTALETALSRIDPGEGVDRLVVSRASLSAVRELADRGVVVIAIDDVQWLDRASEGVIEAVARRVTDLAVGFLLSRRSTFALPPPLGLGKVFGRERLQSIRIGPLGTAELDHLLRDQLGISLPRPRLLELSKISRGNPLFALEVARQSTGAGSSESPGLSIPESLRALLKVRLDALSPQADEAVLLAAAAAHPTTGLIERAAGDSEGLGEALGREILSLEGQRLRFTHPLLASVAYESAFPWRRREVHRGLAEVTDDPEERARHLALGTDDPSEEIAGELDGAAALATARGAPEAAAVLSEHAARLTPVGDEDRRRRRLTQAAEHHISSGDPARGRAMLEGLIEEAEPGPVRGDLLRRLAAVIADDLGVSIQLCEQALAEGAGVAEVEAQVHIALGVYTWLAGDLERAAGHCRAAAECAERAGNGFLLAICLGEMCHAETVLGRPYRHEDMERALELEQEHAAFPPNLRPSFQLGVILSYTDEPERARPLLAAELERAGASGEEAARFSALFRLAELELRTGSWHDARRHAEEAVASVLQAGIDQEQGAVLMMQALIAAHLGDLDPARQTAERALAIAESGGDRIVATRTRGVLGFIELSRGDAVTALDHLVPAARELRVLGVGELSISGVVQNEIEALVACGRIEDAEEEIAFVEERGRPLGRAWHAAVAERGRALVAAARGDAEGARAAIERALEAHQRLPQPFELGRTLLVQGQVERRFKRRGEARAALTKALELFDELGAPRWAERVADELARIPGRPPGTGELSETEQRVAALVLEGLSNKEIAGRLFISVRTVEANLSKVFLKLGVRSRTELARILGRPE